MGPDLQMQNYRISTNTLSENKTLAETRHPPPGLRRGGARGWVPIKGAKILAKKSEGAKTASEVRFYSFQTACGAQSV